MSKCKLYRAAQEHRDLYDALVKSYKLDKDLFESYGKSYSLKRDRKDKDEDSPAGSDQGLKRRKTSKDDEPSKGYKSKESKTSSSKGTKSQPKSSGKSVQVEESVFETTDTEMPQNQGSDLDSDWNANKIIDFTPPQTWISKIAKAEKPPLIFDELMSTPINFSAYVMNNLKIENLTQEHLVGPAFNLLKGTCRSRVKLEYHFEEYRGCQVVPVNYFINNDLEYLKDRSSSRKYTKSTKKNQDAKYDDIQGIEDMVPSNMVSKQDMFSTKRIIAVTHLKVMKWYDHGYLEEIEVRREYQQLYKFKEERGVIFDLNVALRMFAKYVVILKRVEDLQLGVKSYQKKLNITKPETFRSDISKTTLYTAYSNPQGIIYVDKYKRNRLMRLDELYKFSDGTLTFVRSVLHNIASNVRMDYLPKRRWSTLDKQRSRIMIKAINKL
ncbi:hypothetical protein Tco_0826212 [Tanacetum coccineum]